MIVPLNRKEKFLVSFYYTKIKRKSGGVHKKNTECSIKRFEKDKKGKDLETLAKGYAKLSRTDQFNKKAGRKIAFTRALFRLFPSMSGPNGCLLSFEKAEKNRANRAKFWKRFLKEIAI